MRVAVFILWIAVSAQAGVVSRDWRDGTLALKLDDGTAEVEWISPVAFRVTRSWGESPAPALPKISHEKMLPVFMDGGDTLTMRSRFLTLELDRADLKFRVTTGEARVTNGVFAKTADGTALRLGFTQGEKVFGLMGGSTGRLNLRGEKFERRNGLFLSSGGYGVFVRSPARCVFDMGSGTVAANGANAMEIVIYWGPTAKEILEQHLIVTGSTEVTGESLNLLMADRLPKEATLLPKGQIDSWDAFGGLIRTLNQWSLSAILYPAFDLATLEHATSEVKQRALDTAALLPIVYRSSGDIDIDRSMRNEWKPYLMTYLREAHDRGFPLIRPLQMQFSKDPKADQQADVFMLGDEVLLAPVTSPGERRRLDLPKGNWTDVRTNTEYRGNQTIDVEAPVGRVPMFVRNGWIIPLAMEGKMELHYYPSLGGEFFLWEPDVNENSQFHASPAGEYVRVEIETQVRRTYEWVLHHTGAAREVAEEATVLQRVAERGLLRPGTWWHDAAQNNLHVMVQADAGSDWIVNISF